MRFLITAARDPNAPVKELDVTEKMMREYMAFNETLHQAGVLLAAEGLTPGTKGARVGVKNGKRVVLDGPFAESKELVGGFYLVETKSLDEAIAWALKSPVGLGTDDILTIHQMTELSDIPPEMQKIVREEAPSWSAAVMKKGPVTRGT
jgi:hypothetical protein